MIVNVGALHFRKAGTLRFKTWKAGVYLAVFILICGIPAISGPATVGQMIIGSGTCVLGPA